MYIPGHIIDTATPVSTSYDDVFVENEMSLAELEREFWHLFREVPDQRAPRFR